MGYTFNLHHPAKPFVPQSIAYPKQKAKELQTIIPKMRLSECQETVAKALGWKDWNALATAIKHGGRPSLPDEQIPQEEVDNRLGTQMRAMIDARIPPWALEEVVAGLALTCSAATAAGRMADIGPWGAFEEPPEEIAPGILIGHCAKFSCYRLTDEMQARMPARFRLNTLGWYMLDDHAWRVELAFPENFTAEEIAHAWAQFETNEPLLFELETGREARHTLHIGMAVRRHAAASRPTSWFALSWFPDWAFDDGGRPAGFGVVSAIRGKDLVALIDAKGVWSAAGISETKWYGMRLHVVDSALQQGTGATTCISGLKGWEHPPVLSVPFRVTPFSDLELSLSCCAGFASPIKSMQKGDPVPIP